VIEGRKEGERERGYVGVIVSREESKIDAEKVN
jgi:hypothetical protein